MSMSALKHTRSAVRPVDRVQFSKVRRRVRVSRIGREAPRGSALIVEVGRAAFQAAAGCVGVELAAWRSRCRRVLVMPLRGGAWMERRTRRHRIGDQRRTPTWRARALALCTLMLGSFALACPPSVAPFVPYEGPPFRLHTDLGAVVACDATWLVLDIDEYTTLGLPDEVWEALVLFDHPTAHLFGPHQVQVTGPIPVEVGVATRVTLDEHTYVLVIGFRMDVVYNQAVLVRLAFQLPPRPGMSVPAPPPAPAPRIAADPECPVTVAAGDSCPPWVVQRRADWGTVGIVVETMTGLFEVLRVRLIGASGETLWIDDEGLAWAEFEARNVFRDGTNVLVITGHTGGATCCDVEHHFMQHNDELVHLTPGNGWLSDLDGSGVPERVTFVRLRPAPELRDVLLPAVQVWDSAERRFGPVVTRERFSSFAAQRLEWRREDLAHLLSSGLGSRALDAAAQVYALAYYLDPRGAAAEREQLRSVLPADVELQIEGYFAAIEATVDAFIAQAPTWQPPPSTP